MQLTMALANGGRWPLLLAAVDGHWAFGHENWALEAGRRLRRWLA